ncbi:aldehyde dehydrogenase family protein [Streptomyces sp. NPDC057623]|uniref:aldehyde dehydrogenase family protein n=1 Tax=Streptomyces sp. NPDC057623 TaxID=3346187 RepID=UPI0036AD0A19
MTAPATGQVIATVGTATATDADRAVEITAKAQRTGPGCPTTGGRRYFGGRRPPWRRTGVDWCAGSSPKQGPGRKGRLRGRGALLAAGGTCDGWFYRPTVLFGIPPTRPLLRGDLPPRGPVTACETVGQAVEIINSSEYGLSVAILTQDVFGALELAEGIESGAVHINDQTVDDEAVAPLGGAKASVAGGRVGGGTAATRPRIARARATRIGPWPRPPSANEWSMHRNSRVVATPVRQGLRSGDRHEAYGVAPKPPRTGPPAASPPLAHPAAASALRSSAASTRRGHRRSLPRSRRASGRNG